MGRRSVAAIGPVRAVTALVVGLLAVAVALGPRAGEAQSPATVGTNPPGSVFHVIGSGLSKLTAEAGTLRMTVQPYAGSSTFLPLVNGGEVEFGINTAMDAVLAYRGPAFKVGGRNPFPHAPNLRVVMLGPVLTAAPLVRKDSPIRTVNDVRGRRVTGEYPAALTVWYSLFGSLASAGLTWGDVQVVPVPGLNEGIDALVQRRADVSLFALNGAKVREADAAVGVRHISLDCSAQGEQRLRAATPGYYTKRVKAGEAAAVVEDICVIANDIHIVTSKLAPDATVEALLKSTWEHSDRLLTLHPIFREWARARMAAPEATIPYHPAAVRFYREHGAWTPEIEQAQQKLSAR
jgi:TRAP transporter TAXI family solute receptor